MEGSEKRADEEAEGELRRREMHKGKEMMWTEQKNLASV